MFNSFVSKVGSVADVSPRLGVVGVLASGSLASWPVESGVCGVLLFGILGTCVVKYIVIEGLIFLLLQIAFERCSSSANHSGDSSGSFW